MITDLGYHGHKISSLLFTERMSLKELCYSQNVKASSDFQTQTAHFSMFEGVWCCRDEICIYFLY